MPRAYPAEFRARAIALVRAGKQQKQTAEELGIHPVTLSKWIKQDDVDRGLRPGCLLE
jgi:transposase